MQFGHSDDGMVVLIIHSMADDKPLETKVQMTPDRAIEVAAILTHTAAEAREKVKEIMA